MTFFARQDQNLDTSNYHRHRLMCMAVYQVIQISWLTVGAFLLAPLIDDWLLHDAGIENAWLRCLALSAVVCSGSVIASYPIAQYIGFVLERRYGLSRQTASLWFSCFIRRNLTAVVRLGLTMLAMYFLIRTVGFWWWGITSVVAFLWSARRSQLRPTSFGPDYHRVEPIDDPDVLRQMEILLPEGLQFNGVYRICASENSIRPNAYIFGSGNMCRLLVTDTLLTGFTPNEIGVILAHEVGHIAHHHPVKMLAVRSVWSVCGLILCDAALHGWAMWQGQTLSYLQVPPWVMPSLLLVFSAWSLVSYPIIAAIFRGFERAADHYALARASSPDDYRSAMTKIAEFNRIPLKPHWLEILLIHTHPAPADRIALADGRN